MTYTVKNGTWCKDNGKEYYSTTEVGLRAALKAGEITSGTRVVIHQRMCPPATIIHSLNPEPPEGFMVPDGSAIDPVYSELIAIVGPNLPDLREYVLVCAGQNAANIKHDVFTAGQAKQDHAQLTEHTHTATSTVTDPGHVHDVTDPGHTHDVTDPGHDHGRGTQNITGTVGDVLQGSVSSGAFYNVRGSKEDRNDGDPGEQVSFDASRTWEGRSENVTTGMTVDSHATGVSVDSHVTGVTVDTTLQNAGNDDVTRTKEYGVYYYISF